MAAPPCGGGPSAINLHGGYQLAFHKNHPKLCMVVVVVVVVVDEVQTSVLHMGVCSSMCTRATN